MITCQFLRLSGCIKRVLKYNCLQYNFHMLFLSIVIISQEQENCSDLAVSYVNYNIASTCILGFTWKNDSLEKRNSHPNPHPSKKIPGLSNSLVESSSLFTKQSQYTVIVMLLLPPPPPPVNAMHQVRFTV